MTFHRSWLWMLVPVGLSVGVVWLSAQDPKQTSTEGIKVGELAEKLQAREKAVVQKENELRELEQRLATLQTTLDRDRTDLQTREKTLADAQAKFDALRTRLPVDPQMIQTYEKMDPAAGAVAIKELHALNADLAVAVIGTIPPKKAARVLEALNATDAKLSARLLERVAHTKKPAPGA